MYISKLYIHTSYMYQLYRVQLFGFGEIELMLWLQRTNQTKSNIATTRLRISLYDKYDSNRIRPFEFCNRFAYKFFFLSFFSLSFSHILFLFIFLLGLFFCFAFFVEISSFACISMRSKNLFGIEKNKNEMRCNNCVNIN